MSFGTAPEDIVNRALNSIGFVGVPIGDLQEGGTTADACNRIYTPTRQQMLRAANWSFARRMAPLLLLQDATGQTTVQQQASGGPVTVGVGTPGMVPWIYEYQWPTDGIRARWLPQNWLQQGQGIPGNISIPTTPLTTGAAPTPLYPRLSPTRFLVTSDIVPTMVGGLTDWSQVPDYGSIHGQAPAQQTVILTNTQNAMLCYTADIVPPSLFDPLFEQAFVAAIASQVCMAVLPDKKFAMQMRRDQIAIAKAALEQARLADGNEGWNVTDLSVDWMRTRNVGGRWNSWGPNGGGDGYGGVMGYGWDSYAFCDGSAF